METVEPCWGRRSFDVEVLPLVQFVDIPDAHGRVYRVPTSRPQLPIVDALTTVVLPLELNSPDPGQQFRLLNRVERVRLYEIVVREGRPRTCCGMSMALLADVWPELIKPRDVRAAWEFVVDPLS